MRYRAERKGVGITGIGLVSPLGDNMEDLVASLKAGERRIAPMNRIGAASNTCWLGCEIPDFAPTDYIKVRGLRMFNRATKLGLCAAKLAIEDAGLDGFSPEQVGLITASSSGHMENLIQYDRAILTSGLKGANPVNVPFGIPSAVGAQIALSLKLKGFSIGLGNGHCSSINALKLGMAMVMAHRVKACVVVGAFAPYQEMLMSADKAGMLIASGSADSLRPFDAKRSGTVFGEAGSACIIESVETARERGADILGILDGISSTYSDNGDTGRSAMLSACEQAMAGAEIEPGELDLISAGANGSLIYDREEAIGIRNALGKSAHKPLVMAVKSLCGDMVDAGSMLQVFAALSAMREGVAAPIVGLEEAEVSELNYVKTIKTEAVQADSALITSLSLSGAAAALVLRTHHDRRNK